MYKKFSYDMVTAKERGKRIKQAEENERKKGVSDKELARLRKKRRQDDPLLKKMEAVMEK